MNLKSRSRPEPDLPRRLMDGLCSRPKRALPFRDRVGMIYATPLLKSLPPRCQGELRAIRI